MFLIEKLAEEKIQEAIQEGQFNNLPDKGKPYRFDGYLYENPSERIYYKILKDNGFIPPVLDYKKRIEEINEKIRGTLSQFRDSYGHRFAQVMHLLEIEISYPPEDFSEFLKQHHYFLNHDFKIWLLAKRNSTLQFAIFQFNQFVDRNKQWTINYLKKRNQLIQDYNHEILKILLKKRDLMRIETTLPIRKITDWQTILDYQYPALPQI